MSLDIPSVQELDGRGLRIAVLASRYNEALVDALVGHACEVLQKSGADQPHMDRVPGAAELPFAAATAARSGHFDAIICIGVVIAGDTSHHEIIGESTAAALLEVSITQKIPVINGILVVNTIEQAEARAGASINRGKEFALAALEMAQFKKRWTNQQNP